MNLSYKLVKNKLSGELVVASELAKGHKKNTRKTIAASLALLASINAGYGQNTIDLKDIEYKSGTFNNDSKNPVFTDINNNSQQQLDTALKNQGQLSDQDAKIRSEHFLINDGTSKDVKFSNVAIGEKAVFEEKSFETVTVDQLISADAVKLYKKDGTALDLKELPTWTSLDFLNKETVTHKGEHNSSITFEVHQLPDELAIIKANPVTNNQILVKQPPVTFYNFNIVTATNGTINLNDTASPLNLDFGQAKKTSLFTADSSNNQNTNITVGDTTTVADVKIDVKFDKGYVAGGDDSLVKDKISFGQPKDFRGQITSDQFSGDQQTLAASLGQIAKQAGKEEGYVYNISDLASLKDYQKDLINAVALNIISPDSYNILFEMAFKQLSADDYYVEIDYDPTKNSDNDLYLGDRFSEEVGILSILKAVGEKANIVINQNADMTVTNGDIAYLDNKAKIEIKDGAKLTAHSGNIAHGNNNNLINIEQGADLKAYNGRIVKGDNETIATNKANTIIGENMGNVELSNQSSYANEVGTNLEYKDNFITDKIQSNSKFDNKGTMVINASDRDGDKARSATTISGASTFTNHKDAKLSVGVNDVNNSVEIEKGGKLAGGVTIQNNGTFINDGTATLGKKADGSNANITYQLPAQPTENDFLIKDTNTIISAIADSSTDAITITNNGIMTIGDRLTKTSDNHIQHAAGINVEYNGNTENNNIEISNKGTINVGGYHSVGIRAKGNIGDIDTGNGKKITNTGIINVIGANSIGIVATNGATVYNDGTINIGGNNIIGNDNFTINNGQLDKQMSRRNYGLKSEDGATIYTAATSLNLLANDSVGAYARQGGTIHITGNADKNITGSTKENLVYYWISGKRLENGKYVSSKINFNSSEVKLASDDKKSTFFRIDQGAEFNGTSGTKYAFSINGEGSSGLYVASAGTVVTADNGMTFNVNGENTTGIYVTSGAGSKDAVTNTQGNVTLGNGAAINVTGLNASAAVVDGAEYNLNNVATGKFIGAVLNSSASFNATEIDVNSGAVAYRLINSGTLNHSGKINFTGDVDKSGTATGIYIKGGTLNNQAGSDIQVNGVGVDIYHDANNKNSINNSGTITAVNGIAAVRINKGAEFTASGAGLISGNKAADAIRVHDGATLITDQAKIAVDGSGAGIHFMNTDAANEDGKLPTFTLKGTGDIAVKGDKATGILVQGENGKEATANFDSSASKLKINVKDADGNGITTNTSGYVYSGSDVTIESLEGGSALVVNGTTKDIVQSGKLVSNSATAVVDLTNLDTTMGMATFRNTANGKIISNFKDENGALGTAVLAKSGENINFINEGEIKGEIDLWSDREAAAKISLANHSILTGDLIIGNSIISHNFDRINTVTLHGGSQAENIIAESGDTTITLQNVTETEETRAENNKYVFKTLSANGGQKDTIILDKSTYVLNSELAEGISGFEALKIGAGSVFELYKTDLTLNEATDNADSGIFLTEMTSTLKVTNDKDFNLNHELIGKGRVEADLSGNTLVMNEKFADFNSKKFTGTLSLKNTLYDLQSTNTTSLTKATLEVGKGAVVSVAQNNGDQKIGGLKFDGGRVDFQDPLSNLQLSEDIGNRANSLIQVDTLDVTNASGTVSVILEDMYALPKNNEIPVHKPIIEHDQGESLMHIVHAEQINGISSGALKLEMFYKNPNEIIDDTNNQNVGTDGISQYKNEYRITQDIQQGDDGVVAHAIYDYGLVSKQGTLDSDYADRGLHITYKLEEIGLLKDKSFVLTAAKGKTGDDTDLSAKVTGAGHLIINTESDFISLSNGDNDYTGTTTVANGHFYLENDGVLGQTSELILKNGTQTSVLGQTGNQTGTSQTVGALTSELGSTLNLGSKGGLTVKGDKESVITGALVGLDGSTLTFQNGQTTIHSANENFNSNVQLDGQSKVQLYEALAVGNQGTVTITDNAELKIGNHNPNAIDFGKQLIGKGDLTITTGLNLGVVTDSMISLSGDNSGFTGDITIGDKDDLNNTTLIANKNSVGSGKNVSVNDKGTLVLDHSATEKWAVDKLITGNGQLNKIGSGIIELSQDASNYTGKTTVSEGQLIAGKADDKDYILNSKEIEVTAGASFLAASGTIKGTVNNHGQFIGSYGFVDNSVNNYGEFVVGNINKDVKDAASIYTVNGNFTNHSNGVIRLNNKHETDSEAGVTNSGNIGNKLHIKGNYFANGGSIILNTVLNEGFEKTITDSIHVAGNVVKQDAATKLFIQNYGGLGAFTQLDAIKVISVDGHSDNGAFALGAPATIGVYEYTLHKGQTDNNWYLYSNPDYPVYGQPNRRNINPLIGGYLANMATSFEMFNMTLHDRLGNPSYGQSILTGDDRGLSAWGRMATVHRKYRSAQDGLSISGDFYLTQVGADLIKVAAENDGSRRFGVMASYGSSDFTSRSRTTGSEARGKIDQAMSIGLYGTWYQPESWFMDTWLQYSHFKNEVSMKQGSTNKYNSNLLSASIEVGYNHKTDTFDNGDHLIIQPNAQVIYGRLATKAFKDEASGLFAKKNTKNNIQTRLGMKLFYVQANENNSGFKPYVEANWIHNSSSASVTFNDRFKFSSNAPNDIFEVKIGAEGNLSEDWSVWGNVGYQFGKQKYQGYKATMGVKYTW